MTNTEFILSGSTLEAYGNESLLIAKQIADVRNLSQRGSGAFSKEFHFPGCSVNNIAFSNAFDLNVDNRFNPNKKSPFTIKVDSAEHLHGSLQLTSINRNFSNEVIDYVTVFYEKGFDFNKNVGQKYLSDLTMLSATTERITQSIVESNWTNFDKPYSYVLADTTGMKWNSSTYTTFSASSLSPQFKLKTYTDLIISGAGYSITSNFMNSDYYGRFVVMDNSEINVPARVHLEYVPIMGAFATNIWVSICRMRDGVETVLHRISDYAQLFPFPQHVFDFYFQDLKPSDQVYVKIQCGNGFPHDIYNYSMSITYDSPVSTLTVSGLSSPNSTSSPYILPFPTIVTNVNSNWSGTKHIVPQYLFDKAVPKNVKQSDLLLWVTRLFNLYWDIDPENERNLIVEPRDDYFALHGRPHDLSKLLDKSKPAVIKPLSELVNRTVEFTYAEDTDFLNADYKKKTNTVYGRKLVDFDNDFISSNLKLDVGFSFTENANIDGSSEIIVPKIYAKDDAGKTSSLDYKLRLLYYGGIVGLPSEKYNIDWFGTLGGYTTLPFFGEVDNPYSPTESITFGVPDFNYFTVSGYPQTNLYTKYYENYYNEIASKDSKMLTAYFNLSPMQVKDFQFFDKYYFDGSYYILNKIEYSPNVYASTKLELLKINLTAPLFKDGKRLAYHHPTTDGKFNLNLGNNSVSNMNAAIGQGNYIDIDDNNVFLLGNNNTTYGGVTNVNVDGNGNVIALSSDTISISSSGNTVISGRTINILGGSNNYLSGSTNVTLLGVSNFTGTNISNLTVTPTMLVQSGLTANTIFTNSINGIPLSAMTGSTTINNLAGNYLPLSGGTVSGATEIQQNLFVSGGLRVNTQLAKLIDYTANTRDYCILVDSSSTLKVYLPKNPGTGTYFIVADYVGTANVNPITVLPFFAGDTIQNTTGLTIGTSYGAVHFVYHQTLSNYTVVSAR